MFFFFVVTNWYPTSNTSLNTIEEYSQNIHFQPWEGVQKKEGQIVAFCQKPLDPPHQFGKR